MGKKSHKKRPHSNTRAEKHEDIRQISISQCMIVKNEEKNIERALSWAKGLVFEQIVVDTGSTDRTVEIAERMGANVYHFEWINDFSAAKNYAIKQAKGDWIAFLDADEYFDAGNTSRLLEILKSIENDANIKKMITALLCPLVNLDNNGSPFLVTDQIRVFRNSPDIRYVGSIHEMLTNPHGSFYNFPELSIMHTGYSGTSYADTGKVNRNIEMITVALENDPENANLKCYLADALSVRLDEGDWERAEQLYRESILDGIQILSQLRQGAYKRLIAKYSGSFNNGTETLNICRTAYTEFPLDPDICYYYGLELQRHGDFISAREKYSECESLMKQDLLSSSIGAIVSKPFALFYQMVLVAVELGDIFEVIRCATLALREDKYEQGILAPYIDAFNKSGFETPASGIYDLLSKLYDLTSTRDKLTVMQAAKTAGNVELVQLVLNSFTKEELEWLTQSQ